MMKQTLPKEFAEKWIEALESGKYPQVRNRLNSENGYCCLGVACIISGAKDEDLYGYQTIGEYLEDKFKIPGALVRDPSEHLQRLMVMNDTGYSFKEIAQYIRENYEFV